MISNRLRGLLNLHSVGVTVVASGWLLSYAYIVRLKLGGVDLLPSVNLMPYLLAVTGAMVVSMRFLNLMSPGYHRFTWIDSTRLTFRQVAIVALFVFGMMFVLKDRTISRIFVGTYLVSLSAILLFFNAGLPRMLARLAFQKQHHLPTLFIGSQSSLQRLGEWLASKQSLGIHAVGFLTHEPVSRNDSASAFPFLGHLASLERVIRQRLVAQVIMLELPQQVADVRRILQICQEAGCRLLIYNNLSDLLRHPVTPVTEEGHQFYTLQDEPLESPLNRLVKRAFDIALSLPVALVVLPPLTVLVWALQRFQAPGPVFFFQRRSGQRRKGFTIIKFRTMYSPKTGNPDAEESLQAKRGDERVFPLGRFLRSSSLDELPQFINVLKGEMSIVGPRPHLPQHDESFARFMEGYRTRFYVKPGITGLAQCRGLRGEITETELLERRVANDLEYISSWSIWLDLRIVLKTAWQILFPPRSAY